MTEIKFSEKCVIDKQRVAAVLPSVILSEEVSETRAAMNYGFRRLEPLEQQNSVDLKINYLLNEFNLFRVFGFD